MSRDNFDQHLRDLFDGFEPDVTPGKFEPISSGLDQLQHQNQLVQQTQFARRLAAAATIVALGALGWASLQNTPTPSEKSALSEATLPESKGGTTASIPVSTSSEGAVERDGIARTSTTVRIAGIDNFARNEGDNGSSGETQADDTGTGEKADNSAEAPPVNEKALVAAAPAVSSDRSEVDETPKASASDWGEDADAAATEEDDVLERLASSVQEACEGTEVSFSLGDGDLDGSVLWNFGDGNFSNETHPTHVFKSPGTYDITISLRSRDNGMIRTKTVENMIVVRPKPEADLSWDATLDPNGEGLLVKYVDQTIGSSSSTWLVDGKGLDRSEQMFAQGGEHAVHLVVSNAYGCQDSEERNFVLGDRHNAKAPGLFSPDGDGRYDAFLPGIVHEVSGDWELKIFDADGNEVFRTTDAQSPWTGLTSEGKMASSGAVYSWVLKINQKHRLPAFFFDNIRIER